MSEITVMNINVKTGGYDPETRSFQRLDLLADLATHGPNPPDVVMLQEGFRFGDDGAELMHHAGRLLGGMTGFLMPPADGLLHEVVFLRCPPFIPLRHYNRNSPGVYRDQQGWVHASHPDLGDRPLMACSVQLAHEHGADRLRAAKRYTRYAARGKLSILAGDINEVWPDCPGHAEFEPDWALLPAHSRAHKTLDPGDRAPGQWMSDRRTGTVLVEAGWVNVGCRVGDMTPTVQHDVDNGQGARIDHILVSPDLAPAVTFYQVDVSQVGSQASDHRAEWAVLDPALLPAQ
jgi:endonuclease/exonuclease/phosphatase family metal-dependent hydrolase